MGSHLSDHSSPGSDEHGIESIIWECASCARLFFCEGPAPAPEQCSTCGRGSGFLPLPASSQHQVDLKWRHFRKFARRSKTLSSDVPHSLNLND